MDVENLVRDHYSGDDLEAVVLGALARAGVDTDALRLEELRIHERLIAFDHQHLVVHEAHDVLDLAKLQRHVDVVAREFLGGDRHLAVPGVPVNEFALAGIPELPVAGVELGRDDDLFHC